MKTRLLSRHREILLAQNALQRLSPEVVARVQADAASRAVPS